MGAEATDQLYGRVDHNLHQLHGLPPPAALQHYAGVLASPFHPLALSLCELTHGLGPFIYITTPTTTFLFNPTWLLSIYFFITIILRLT